MSAEPASERLARLPRVGRLRERREGALVREAQRGSADALEELFRRHWRRAHRAAFLVVGDAAAAEDIAQESFLAAIRALDRFDRRRPFGPWLHRITVNRAIDFSRAQACAASAARRGDRGQRPGRRAAHGAPLEAPRGDRALSPTAPLAAGLERRRGRSTLSVVGEGGRRVLFSARGVLTGPTWSPDGRWLLVGWPEADQWLFIRAERPQRVIAFDRISEQFDPGGDGEAGFPRVARWILPER